MKTRGGRVANWLQLRKVQLQLVLAIVGLGIATTCVAIPVVHAQQMKWLRNKWKSRSAAVVKDGYQDRISYFPGERAAVFLNTETVGTTKIRLLNTNKEAVDSVLFLGFAQAAPPDSAFFKGFGYRPSFIYRIPKRLRSGVYHWEGSKLHFIVKSAQDSVDFVVVYPSNTEQAYNELGGRSLYDHNSGKVGRAHTVSFLRPINYQASDKINNRDYVDGFLRWLEKSHYRYSVVSDMDMDDSATLAKGKVAVVIGHSEYWTRMARENFDRFVHNGHHAIVLSGNTMWWQVRYSADRTQLICYKDSLKDPIEDCRFLTTNWYEPVLGLPILGSIGAHFPLGGYAYKYDLGWDGYKVMAPESPLLQGTGLKNGQIFKCANKEIDGAPLTKAGFDRYKYPVIDSSALNYYKVEIVGFDLGFSDKRWPSHCVGTFIVGQLSLHSGRIINVAGTDWCAPATFEGSDGPKVQRITQNMFDLQLGNLEIFSPSVRPWSGATAKAVN